MQSLSHSRQPNRSGKRICNGHTNNVNFAAAKSIYDDVFGGPPKFGAPTLSPRMEDYAEIFGSFHAARASSIPVLDLPAVDESEVFFDVRGSGFDYTEVFGGFNGLDFAVSFDDLVQQRNGGYDGSSEEAWTPAETESLSGESDRSVHNQFSPNRDSYQPYDGNTEFNISYHKTNVRSREDMSNGMTHLSQLHAVPGFTYMVDETASLRKIDTDTPSIQVAENSELTMNFERGMIKKNSRKAKSDPVKCEIQKESSLNDFKPPEGIIDDGSQPNSTFVGVSEISLKTHPSSLPPPTRPPPALDAMKGNSKTSNHGPFSLQGTEGIDSPPYFDVEVDANSSAAVSAAAMKKAMLKAQARLRSAKELMEKKKDGAQGHNVMGSTDVRKKKGENMDSLVDRSSRSKEEALQGTFGKKNTGKEYFREEKQEALSKTDVTPNALQGEDFFDLACGPGEERLAKRSCSPEGSDDIDGSGEWKDSTQFFELVKTDKSQKAFEQTSHGKILVEDDNHGFGGNNRKINRYHRDHGQEKNEKKMREAKVTWEQVGNNDRETTSRESHGRKENEKDKAAKEVPVREEKEKEREAKASRKVSMREEKENEKKAKAAKEVLVSEEKENEKNAKAAREDSVREDTGRKMATAQQSAKCEKKLTGPDVSDTLGIQLGEKECEAEHALKHREKNELIDANTRISEKMEEKNFKREHGEKRQRKVWEREQKEIRIKMALDQEENESLKDSRSREESDERSEALKHQNDEKKSVQVIQQGHDVKGLQEPFKWEENEKRLAESSEGKEMNFRLSDAHIREDREKREGASETEENGKMFEGPWETELGDATSREDHMQHETESPLDMPTAETVNDYGEVQECAVQRRMHGHSDTDQNGRKLEVSEGSLKMNPLNGKLKFQGVQLFQNCDRNEDQFEAMLETSSCKINGKGSAVQREKIILQAAEVMHVEDQPKASSVAHVSDLEPEVSQSRMKEMASDNAKKAEEDAAATWMEENKFVSKKDSRSENNCWESANDRGNRERFTAAVNEEGKKDKDHSAQVLKDSTENGSKTAPTSQGRGNIQKIAQHVNLSHFTERREKTLHETSTLKYREAERMKREKELEEERLRKIEEEREREREREKDRMALDRETLEIRDKFTIERMTYEARQRAMAEARDRLERACAEAREKTIADKALMEARLRAERAAMERATAEARERAAEKTMTERSVFEARQRMDRSISDKFSACATSGMGQSHSSSALQDQQFRSTSFTSGTTYQCSSASGEKPGEVEGETAQRCRARLERYRRTAERAAKALAEKNMRDLLAQREQAERSRLAETLDAEVRRWSSGKEGNLRALLSTLQYILGPDSGWQPIPLTEVITSAAVKKAYRKATLCVHPDKLQQRGASIQQKYICEKVFDLLKEAWVKFNSEER